MSRYTDNTRRMHWINSVAMIDTVNAFLFLEKYVNQPKVIIINTYATHQVQYNIHKHADEPHTKYEIKIQLEKMN